MQVRVKIAQGQYVDDITSDELDDVNLGDWKVYKEKIKEFMQLKYAGESKVNLYLVSYGIEYVFNIRDVVWVAFIE